MIDNIRKFQSDFLMLGSEERIALLDRYEFMHPYQKTALFQCKKYMTPAEKRKYKQVTEKLASKSNEDEPQPN